MNNFDLQPWRLSHMLTHTRTVGQIGLRKNGTSINVRVRVDGKPIWFAFDGRDLERFLESDSKSVVLSAESDGNAET